MTAPIVWLVSLVAAKPLMHAFDDQDWSLCGLCQRKNACAPEAHADQNIGQCGSCARFKARRERGTLSYDYLRVYWSAREKALVYDGPGPTGGMLAGVFERITLGAMNERLCGHECRRNGMTARLRERQPIDPTDARTLAQELEARGYDLTTLKFSVRKKAATPTDGGDHGRR